MAIRPYLAFTGSCRDAFTRYREILGGELTMMAMADLPPEAGPSPEGAAGDAIMHAQLNLPDGVLMGADDPTGSFEGNINGMCVNLALPDPGEAKRVFDALSEGGTIQQPVTETFFSPAFGMCIDRYGVPWMVMVDAPMQ